jgi:hypothetical protein
MRRRAITLLLFASVLAPGGARAADATTIRPPTLLWKTYPLEQRPATIRKTPAAPVAPAQRKASPKLPPATIRKTPPAAVAPAERKASPKLPPAVVGTAQTGLGVRRAAPAQTVESTRLRNTLVLGLLLASLAAMMSILLMRTFVPVRVGGPRRARPRPRPPSPTPSPGAEPPAAAPSGELLDAPRPKLPEAPKFADAPAQASADRERVLTAEVGEIKLWRGFRKCRLYAALSGSDEPFAASPHFRLRPEQTPGDDAERALSDLLDELERGGWEVIPHDGGLLGNWYQYRLVRSDPRG